MAVERWNRLHPEQEPRPSHVVRMLGETEGVQAMRELDFDPEKLDPASV